MGTYRQTLRIVYPHYRDAERLNSIPTRSVGTIGQVGQMVDRLWLVAELVLPEGKFCEIVELGDRRGQAG